MSAIEWTDTTWNPVIGCRRVSPGCTNCYAEKMAQRIVAMGGPAAERYRQVVRIKGRDVACRAGEDGEPLPRWNGKAMTVPEKLGDPLRWRKPRMVFVNSMSDLFHEDVPDDYIAAVFGVMAACPQHTFQVLTKRPERAASFFRLAANYNIDGDGAQGALRFIWEAVCESAHIDMPESWEPDVGTVWPLPNVWLGVSVEDQQRADERIPLLLQCPAEVRFLSCEPLLGPVDISDYLIPCRPCEDEGRSAGGVISNAPCTCGRSTIDWVIVGGESGPAARPMDIAWARDLMEQCTEAGVACFVKQLGAHVVFEPCVSCFGNGLQKSCACMGGPVTDGRAQRYLLHRKGADPSEWPEDLRRREFPGRAV